MKPKNLLAVETLEKKKKFFDKFGLNLFASIDKNLSVDVEPVAKAKKPKM